MIVLMHAVVLAALLTGPVRADDSRVAVTLLPTQAQGTSGAPLDRALAASLAEQPAFRSLPLGPDGRARLEGDAACRALPACRDAALPAGVSLVVDPSLEQRDGLLVLDLGLLYGGTMVRRHSSAVRSGELDAVVARELPLLLAGWSTAARLYQRALQGDAEAAQALEATAPGSTWLQALEQERSR